MSLPKIPDMNPSVTVDRTDAVNLLIFSIGMEEIGLSHIINAEGEKIQYVLGTLVDADNNIVRPDVATSVEEILNINESVNGTLKNVLRNQLLLQLKLEDALAIEPTSV